MCEGKKDLLLLDFLWHTGRHELARPAHLICETDEVADAMISRMDGNAGVELDLEEEKEGAEGDAIDAREMALAKQLEALKRRKQKLVDPLQFEMSILDADLANYEPRIGAELNAPSEGQRGLLEQAAYSPTQSSRRARPPRSWRRSTRGERRGLQLRSRSGSWRGADSRM